MASELHDFEVLAEIARRDGSVRFAPLSNVRSLTWSRKTGATVFEIGAEGKWVHDVGEGKISGGLVLVDAAEFDRVRAEMEARRGE